MTNLSQFVQCLSALGTLKCLLLLTGNFSRRWWRHIAITGRTDFQNTAKCGEIYSFIFVFVKKQRTIERKKKRSKISALESCYANRIYVLIGVELRPYGQKLVQFCKHTHTHTHTHTRARARARVSFSSIDKVNTHSFQGFSLYVKKIYLW